MRWRGCDRGRPLRSERAAFWFWKESLSSAPTRGPSSCASPRITSSKSLQTKIKLASYSIKCIYRNHTSSCTRTRSFSLLRGPKRKLVPKSFARAMEVPMEVPMEVQNARDSLKVIHFLSRSHSHKYGSLCRGHSAPRIPFPFSQHSTQSFSLLQGPKRKLVAESIPGFYKVFMTLSTNQFFYQVSFS